MRAAAGLGALSLALLLVGCGGTSTDTDPQTTGPEMDPPSGPCTTFDDHSAAKADRTVHFGGKGGSGSFSYSPMCMEIAKGQSVVFAGDFSVHPLRPGSAPDQPKSGSAKNPIPETDSGNTTITVKFPSAGGYPFYCGQHFAAGMAGAIDVHE